MSKKDFENYEDSTLQRLQELLYKKCDYLDKYLIPDLVNIVKSYLTIKIGLDVLQYLPVVCKNTIKNVNII
jgi:hypothetical protein